MEKFNCNRNGKNAFDQTKVKAQPLKIIKET